MTAQKNFVGSGSCGPAIVTLDEIENLKLLELTVDVNSERRQHLRLDDLIFSFGEIAYISQPFELQPGDVILTGSPAGIGSLRRLYLKPGDVLRVCLLDSRRGLTLLVLENTVELA